MGLAGLGPEAHGPLRLRLQPDVAGGSAGLADLVDEYGEALEADFARYYHLDLRDFLTGVDHPARALRLIGYLPEGSAFRSTLAAAPDTRRKRRAAAGWEEHYGWTSDSYLLAAIYSAVMATGGSKDSTYPALPGRAVRKGKPLIPSD